jgi:endogenous inhibitor of DNA gyrase (YacG/DUF329 family)
MNDGGNTDDPGAGGSGLHRCSICGAPSTERYRPFCTKRCADIDLSRWLGGRYAIAGGNSDADEDGDEASPGPERKDGHNEDE